MSSKGCCSVLSQANTLCLMTSDITCKGSTWWKLFGPFTAFHVWWEMLASRSGNQARNSIHFDTPWGDPVMITWLQQKRMLCISNLSGLKHEAALCCTCYSPRQEEVLNSKYRWCVISSRWNLNTRVVQLHTQVDHEVGTILSNYSSICPSALCYFHVGKRSISEAPATHFC